MLPRLYDLLSPTEKRAVLRLLPLVVVAALFEVVGVAAVVPFFTLLGDPGSAAGVPLVGHWLAGSAADPLTVLRWAGVGAAVAVVLMNLVGIVANWRLLRFAWGLNDTLSTRLFTHYLAQPYTFMLSRNSAAMANNVMQEVYRLTSDGFVAALTLVARAVVALAIVAFLLVLDPTLAVVAFAALAGSYALIYAAVKGVLRRVGREATGANRERLRLVNEGLGGFKEIKLLGLEEGAGARYRAPSKRYADAQSLSGVISTVPRYALEAMALGGMILIAVGMAGRTESFGAALPLLGVYAVAGMRLLPALQAIFGAVARLRYAEGALEAIATDLTAEAELPQVAPPEAPLAFEERILLRAVSYRYPGSERRALNEVDLSIPRRGSVALIGRTGAGKTTLADVVLGLLPPTEGTISVDDVTVTAANLLAYRRLFGYVPQSIFLIDGTVAENVAFGMPAALVDHAAIERACEAAQLSSFIEGELPNGYESVVGERGVRLSGGQRQRIGIARALYRNPQVLVFDEATSALDVHTERAVYDALRVVAGTRTVITIAHRLETVAGSDLVVVLEEGAVVDVGDPGRVLRDYRLARKGEDGLTEAPSAGARPGSS